VKNLTHFWGGDTHWELDGAENPHEATYLTLDCSKAKRLLGWSPKLNLFTALAWVVEWYQGYLNKKDMRELSKVQISRYENTGPV
jgi:CDP-glucose 4,6-dehydratase